MISKSIKQDIEDLTLEYKKNIVITEDYEKYKLYSLVTGSTQLEGSTLDEIDTQILLDDGLTAKGKPLEHHLMVKDNYNAMSFAMQQAENKKLFSSEFLKKCNSLNMAQTGQIVNNALGTVDGREGEYRLVSAFSEALGYYLNATKIPQAVNEFCQKFNKKLSENKSDIENLITSFDTHVNLVLIHPWMDGNKRTSRLIMNFVQKRAELPLTKIHLEESREYLQAIKTVKDTENIEEYRKFMCKQHIKTMENEIEEFKKNQKKGFKLKI
jgi:Fic family protein